MGRELVESEFLTPLRVEKCTDGRWKLLEPLAFFTARFKGVLIVPAGFVTDFASTPRLLWTIYPKDGPWSRAAVMHDAGYWHQLVSADLQRVHLIKPFCDDLFREGLEADHVHPFTCAVMHRAVAMFGKAQKSQAELDAERKAHA